MSTEIPRLRSGAGGIDSQNRGSGGIGEFQIPPFVSNFFLGGGGFRGGKGGF